MNMKLHFPWLLLLKWFLGVAALGIATLALYATHHLWLPPVQQWADTIIASRGAAPPDGPNHGGSPDDQHSHADDPAAAESLALTPQARANVGLRTGRVELTAYQRTISVPARATGRPGRSQVEVTAVMGGRVTRVYPVQGEAVQPGQPLFDLQLTHEELVQAQSDLLRFAEQLDVERREIERLQTIVESGAIPGRRLLERRYEEQKVEAQLNAQRQSLLLHGLTEDQIDDIIRDRRLLREITVPTPPHPRNGHPVPPDHPFAVQNLQVLPGQYVDAGAPLCTLMDYAQLYIEGQAFEQDAGDLLRAAREDWAIRGTLETGDRDAAVLDDLHIVYVDNEIDPDSRALHFYVGLPNAIAYESRTDEGHWFITWLFKPGQRIQLHIPVEQWDDRIVLPTDAVAQDGVEAFVFRENGDHFDRIPVRVEYQDQLSIVIANDGSLFPGDTVALSGAHQLQMALKNQSGGGTPAHTHTH